MGYIFFVNTLDNYRAISGIEVTRYECYKANLAPCSVQLEKYDTFIKDCSFHDLAVNIKAHFLDLKHKDKPLPETWGVFIDKIFIPGVEILEW
eukprot:6509572-Heterocapsa_arctica.AAC.1